MRTEIDIASGRQIIQHEDFLVLVDLKVWHKSGNNDEARDNYDTLGE